jgi:hypothetical protein
MSAVSKADDEALEKSYRASLGALGVGQSMGHTVNLATVWGACATEKGRQFRQMSTDLSEFCPMNFCIEERVTGNGNVTGHKVKKDPFFCHNFYSTESVPRLKWGL